MTLVTMGPANPSPQLATQLHIARTGASSSSGDSLPAFEADAVTLKGFDLSSRNTAAQVAEALLQDFVIVKASEGVSYVNPFHDGWVQDARDVAVLVGHYHYAGLDSNGPDAEARAFLAAADAKPGDVVVLDFEPPSILPAHPTWVLAFAATVTSESGAPCWLYTNQSQGKTLMSLSSVAQRADLAKLPLWKGYYQPTIGDLMGWSTWAAWQYTSTPVDTNLFNGDANQWRSLGIPEENAVALTPAEIQAIANAVLDAEIVKMPAGTDKTSLRRNAEWADNQFTGIRTRLDKLDQEIAAIPPAPSAAEVAKATNDEAHRRSEA